MASLKNLKTAFWLVISGRANKTIPRGMEEGRIYIGKRESPIAIIKRSEISSFLTSDFWSYYQIWSRFNVGLGLPYGGGWAEYPNHLIEVIQAFESEWRTATHG